MLNFKTANDAQLKAITTTEGPVLITAGPGAGKTFTLVSRVLYLLTEKGLKPENIFISTFTEKAAKELVTRITNELNAHNMEININEMYIGTFHSLCLRIIKENIDFAKIKKNYRLLDDLDQPFLVYNNLYGYKDRKGFKDLPGFSSVIDPYLVDWKYNKDWQRALKVCSYVNIIREELVDPFELIEDKDQEVAAIGHILNKYEEITADNNALDFAALQIEAYRLLKENPEILKNIREKITHLMIDEYQDTNYIQELLTFLLGGGNNNICVVGDDDQALYRFRGATVRNILEFPNKFKKGECKIIPLNINYRSDSDIVDVCNTWINSTSWRGGSFSWGQFRHNKSIVPHKIKLSKSPAAVKIVSEDTGFGSDSVLYGKIAGFIKDMKERGIIADYNQIAFLFHSLTGQKVRGLVDSLESHGISVYSPRSNIFFEREEIMSAIGLLLLMFPNYVSRVNAYWDEWDESKKLKYLNNSYGYYNRCMEIADLRMREDTALEYCVMQTADLHSDLEENTDYNYSSLLYRLFSFGYFANMLGTDLDTGVTDLRPTRNLAMLTQLIGKFESANGIKVLGASKNEKGVRKIDRVTIGLFDRFLMQLLEDGIHEYEDDVEYAPSGCVSFLTIHQAKGMEFPIVIVDPLFREPGDQLDGPVDKIAEKYFERRPFEPKYDIKYFDFWRLYYTAFSRAQDLLILTTNYSNRRNWERPKAMFLDLYASLPPIDDFNMDDVKISRVKDANLKDVYSFTSHIAVYETCPLQYKFYKELEFSPVKTQTILFGTLIHSTIEDVHRAVLRGDERVVNRENIWNWLETNYATLSKREHAYLSESGKKSAFRQVLNYVDRQNGDWSRIKNTEVDVSLLKPNYILEGKIDLIRGEGDTVEIVDFKGSRKPDGEKNSEYLKHYERQLHIYAHLVEKRTGQKVSKMHLYYTAEPGDNPMISYDYNESAVEGTMRSFDETVSKIQAKVFPPCNNKKVCAQCDFKQYCSKNIKSPV